MSAWGNAWGFAWGNAWGIVLNPKPEPGMTLREPVEMRTASETVEYRTVRQPLVLSFVSELEERTVLLEHQENRSIRS